MNRIQCGVVGTLLAVLVLPAMSSPLRAASPNTMGDAPEFSGQVSPDLHELMAIPEHGRTYQILLVLFQLAAILAAAKIVGWLSERIHVPGVVGELMAGALIGPYVLGHLIRLPLGGAWVSLFPAPTGGQWPLNDIIWSFAQFASIILLFITGLHTDLKQFLRYVGPASLVALIGVLAPFLLGVAVVLYIPAFKEVAQCGTLPIIVPALFIGAILAATSIGITARVLGDINRLDSPEGVTIIGAAVVDDVLGIIALAIVGGMAAAITAGGSAGSISLGAIGGIAGKAFGVWIGLTMLILVLAKPIEWVFGQIKYTGAMVGLALSLAFICSGVAEFFGLAFIIGAYSAGLGLSRTQLARKLMDELRPIGDFIIPVFFASLGMLVNFHAMFSSWTVVIFGLVVTAAAILGKLVGCGLAALPGGFNLRGAYRIGIGMMPRGEVALIVAGIGLSRQLINDEIFGVSIMMTLITTLVAPILLVPAFAKGGSGRRVPASPTPKLPGIAAMPGLILKVPEDLAEVLLDRLVKVAEENGWAGSYESAGEDMYLLRSGADAAQLRLENGSIRVDASDTRQPEFVGYLRRVQADLTQQVTGIETAAAPPAE